MPEKETCLNEGEKALQAVRTEAGHPTYLEYLYATDHEYLGSRCADQRKDVHPIKCSIIDLSINTRSVTMSAQEFCSEISPAETAKEILAALRQPPRSACLRIVLWWLTDREHSGLTPELLNVCGLGLKIDSRFFEAIIEKTDRGYLSTRMEMIQPFLSSPAFRAKCLVFGSAAAIVARDYIIGEPNVPPVLLIVGWNDKNWANEMSYIDEDWSAVHHARHSDDLMHREDYNCQVFSNNVIKSEFLRSQMYIKTLNIMLQQSDSTHIGDGNIIFLSVLPLIHLDSLHMYAKMRLLRSRNYFEFLHRTDDSSAELMKLERYILRQHIEDSETCRQNFPTFARSQGGIDALDNQEYRSSQEFWRNALDEARRIELAIRDDMQLQVSQLSLKESKTSIELSNRQIEESRRVKIFTILALVYVPLNTVTSIYGMNIQQINGTGHNIWIFVVTSLCALLVTGLLWYCIEAFNRVYAGRNYITQDDQGNIKYGIALRVSMLFESLRDWVRPGERT